MDEKLNGYMSLEADYLFPIILFIYYLVIMSSLLLMCRCLNSQNNYIIGMRGASFTRGEEEYGEVIYGTDDRFNKSEYAMSRLDKAGSMYVAFPVTNGECAVNGRYFIVETHAGSKIGRNDCTKECVMIDPVSRIREQRY